MIPALRAFSLPNPLSRTNSRNKQRTLTDQSVDSTDGDPEPLLLGRPLHHANNSATHFVNPWPSAHPHSWPETLVKGVPLTWQQRDIAKHPKARKIRVLSPVDFGSGQTQADEIKATWLGHASCYTQLPCAPADQASRSFRILFDPVFSHRVGPTPLTGVSRHLTSPCKAKELPGVHAVCISHNHYDHLDHASIVSIHKHHPSAVFFVPLGLASWIRESGIPEAQIHEMDWWQDHWIELAQAADLNGPAQLSDTLIRITCVPAQHNSGRSIADLNASLWCGWVVEQFLPAQDPQPKSSQGSVRQCAVYFAGDTGYRRYANSDDTCPVFKDIGKKFGYFDLSFIPIWRGGTLGFVSWSGVVKIDDQTIFAGHHASPADAVAIHQDVNSQNSIAVHFATFVGAEIETYEALVGLSAQLEQHNIAEELDSSEKASAFAALDIGQTTSVKCRLVERDINT